MIRDAEQGLLHLKRFRLLKEADVIFTRQAAVSVIEDVKVEALDSAQVKPEPLESECYSIGSKCRFRHKDGRWYNGNIISFEGDSSARISFLNPTSESMLVCGLISDFVSALFAAQGMKQSSGLSFNCCYIVFIFYLYLSLFFCASFLINNLVVC